MDFIPSFPMTGNHGSMTQEYEGARPIKERILAEWRENGFPGTQEQNSNDNKKKNKKPKRRYPECSACQFEARLADVDTMSTTSTITPDYLTHDHPRSNSESSTASSSSEAAEKPNRSLRKRIADKLTPGPSNADPERSASSASASHHQQRQQQQESETTLQPGDPGYIQQVRSKETKLGAVRRMYHESFTGFGIPA